MIDDLREEDLSDTWGGDDLTAPQKNTTSVSAQMRKKMAEAMDDKSLAMSDYSHGSNRVVMSPGDDMSTGTASRWKCMALSVLLSLGLFVTVSAWVVLSQCDENKMEATFTLAATQIQDGVKSRSHLLVEEMEGESETLSDFALEMDAIWPFYVPHSFERRAQHIRDSTGLQALGFAPLVDQGNLDVWNRFVQFHDNASVPSYPVYRFEEGERTPYSTSSELTDNPEFYAPIWRLSPTPLDWRMINYDVFSDGKTQELFEEIKETGSIVISDILNFSPVVQSPASNDYNERDNQNDIEQNITPHSVILQPVYDHANDNDQEPVAVLFGVLYWEAYLTNLLPTSTKGIICEFQNSCGQSIRYSVDGDTASFLQQYDAAHEPSESPLFKIPFLHDHLHQNSTSCKYTLYVYPSTQFRSDNESSKPATYAAILALLFLLAAVVLLISIRAIRKRQNEMLSFAFEANEIMANLIPSNFFSNAPSVKCKEDSMSRASAKDRRAMLAASLSDRYLPGTKETDNSEAQLDDSYISFASRSHTAGGLSNGGLSNGGLSGGSSHNKKKKTPTTIDEECSHTGGGLSGGVLSLAGFSRGGRSASSSQSHRMHFNTEDFASRPIADLFPEATVLYADIVGFSAWSSSREPFHVFELLESVYSTFDAIARRHEVFKVETVGDCYTAVTGVPFPNAEHAVAMAVFARKIMIAFYSITQTLEVSLGPETTELDLKIGIHSGPVTAGVLRGDRNRFQMFGGTVARASRIEEEGDAGRILVSKDTADLLTTAEKADWLMPRDKNVRYSGGECEVFWLAREDEKQPGTGPNKDDFFHPALVKAAELIDSMDENCLIKAKHQRLIDWIVDQMKRLLKEVVVQRELTGSGAPPSPTSVAQGGPGDPDVEQYIPQVGVAQSEVCVFDEVKEVITMPSFDVATAVKLKKADEVELSADVIWQLHDYVTSISTMYRSNPFHNFEHATHVTMSVIKLLSRVVSPTDSSDAMKEELKGKKKSKGKSKRKSESRSSTKKNVFELHDYSYGISSDPLSQFALVFGALIHDVDHVGVSNAQLVKEGSRLARIYKSQSVAEQNSVNIGWDLLMDPAFEALRRCIFTNETEFERFRATVINVVMATDIVDKDLKELRNARWDKAFSKEVGEESSKEDSDRKATIVLEHLIQASDISHTMQHWHVYQKWNHRLFRELYIAHKKGRMAGNPADFWYKGEIGFFDFYIIPLAKKLRDCGVFGVSCDEFLNYACDNRAQWVAQGEDVVRELIKSVESDKEIQSIIDNYKASEQAPDETKEGEAAKEKKEGE